MTLDTKALRRLAQEATPGPWKACRNHECYEGAYFEIDPEDQAEYAAKPFTRIEARTGVVAAAHDLFEFDMRDAEFIAAANPAAITEILDRLEDAEKTKNNWLRANAPGGWIDDLRMERNALHARIKEMEQQEPVAHVWRCDNGHIHGSCERFLPMGTTLYALPGAKGEDE